MFTCKTRCPHIPEKAITFLITILVLFSCSTDNCFSAETVSMPPFEIAETIDIAEVLSGFPVGFSLLTAGKRQYIAYYDKDHRMTVAARSLDSDKWQYQVLPTSVGWDSHNYITMALDRDGHLHVSGNMHCVKLIYFRTEVPADITTLKRYPMTGKAENRATYPKFMTDQNGELIFNYRDGGSGNGMRIYNKYDRKTRTWSRLLDKPLLDGQGQRNAYPAGPVQGPDGWFHIVWVWRDTPDCATNHHLSYARSKDLIHWETAAGEKIELPMTLGNKSLCVDPIPSGGGIINGCEKLIFDSDNRPIITYHKSDENGNMQIYATRFEQGKWVIRQLTDWNKPVKFSGRGSMGFIGIRISAPTKVVPDALTITYRHRDYGSGRLVIDEKNLRPIDRKITLPRQYPSKMNKRQIDFEGIGIRRAPDTGASQEPGISYVLQWETLGRNFDRPRKPPLPKPSMLKLYKLSTGNQVFTDNFDEGLQNWKFLRPESWKIKTENGNSALVLLEKGKQRPGVRRPGEYGLIRNKQWTNVTVNATIKTLMPDEVTGRDVCILFGYVDDTHFYYTHLCSDSNGTVHNVIMKVSGSERKAIMKEKLPEVRLTARWHNVRVEHLSGGSIKVWMDDMNEPLMTADDKDYPVGMVGLGSFDDIAMFDSVKVEGMIK